VAVNPRIQCLNTNTKSAIAHDPEPFLSTSHHKNHFRKISINPSFLLAVLQMDFFFQELFWPKFYVRYSVRCSFKKSHLRYTTLYDISNKVENEVIQLWYL
jgi:hypothetical protein